MTWTMKVVGRRKMDCGDPVEEMRVLQHTNNRLRGTPLIPRGVFRFKTFAEADEWMIRTMAATHVRLKSRTS